ncbi:Uncharacterised protein [Escherichia coli]|uniref:Uncharacterized protein n=1 Tax=Escherichia coli TaxID=562 RepID=A0AB38F2Y9_ECOLX|nr:Uncharacterised protein [Escherichia coli]
MNGASSRAFINAENIQPLLHQFLLAIRNGLINANRIEIARKNHITHRGTDPVIQMQTTADVTDMLFDVPDGFAAARDVGRKASNRCCNLADDRQ